MLPPLRARLLQHRRVREKSRILLAEDNEVNQLVVTELLANAGYRCDVVGDGIRAIDAAMTGVFDLVLMDCQMPGMDWV